MSGPCPTVRIKVEPCKGNPAGEVDINVEDFKEGMITVEDYYTSIKKAEEAALRKGQPEPTINPDAPGVPVDQVDPRAEQTPDALEEPKPQTRVVEAEGKVEAKANKRK